LRDTKQGAVCVAFDGGDLHINDVVFGSRKVDLRFAGQIVRIGGCGQCDDLIAHPVPAVEHQ